MYAGAAVDWISVLSAGVFGAIGGALGAWLGRLTASKRLGLIAIVVFVTASQVVHQSVVRPRLTAWQLERELVATPVYAAVQEVDPETYDRIIEAVRAGAATRASRVDVMNQIQLILNPKIIQYVAAGTDDAILGYYESVVKRFEDTSVTSVETCHLLATGQPAGDVARHITPETQAATLVALEILVRSTADGSETEYDQDEAESDLAAIAAEILEDERDAEILQGKRITHEDYARSCDLNIALHEQILQLEPARAAGLIRFLAAQLQQW